MIWKQGVTLQDVEDQAVLSALEYFKGNRMEAAKDLGIVYRTFMRMISRLRKLGFSIPPSNQKADVCQ